MIYNMGLNVGLALDPKGKGRGRRTYTKRTYTYHCKTAFCYWEGQQGQLWKHKCPCCGSKVYKRIKDDA